MINYSIGTHASVFLNSEDRIEYSANLLIFLHVAS